MQTEEGNCAFFFKLAVDSKMMPYKSKILCDLQMKTRAFLI